MLGIILATNLLGASSVTLPNVYSDHMVLQREQPIKIWGWAEPGARLQITVGERGAITTTPDTGTWFITLPPMEAGGPHEVRIEDTTFGGEVVLHDVLIGDVWIASGQSNMEWAVANSDDAEAEIAGADWPQIRLLHVPRNSTLTPQANVDATWEVCSPSTIADFSAVAYSYGRKLHRELGVPIGLVNTSWGGTPAQAWTPRQDLAANPVLRDYVAAYAAPGESFDELVRRYRDTIGDWADAAHPKLRPSPDESFPDVSRPGAIDLPGTLDAGPRAGFDGVIWLRKTFEASAAGPLFLEIGAIDDFDVTYLDGEEIGRTGVETMDAHQAERRYRLSGGLNGEHELTIRVYDWMGGAHLRDHVRIVDGEGEVVLDLAGRWEIVTGEPVDGELVQAAGAMPVAPRPEGDGWAPGGLYNGMIAPLIRTPMRGAIWYQGESNAGDWLRYRTLFPQMIQSWREDWKREFPFYFVQLANWEPGGQAWPFLREAQTRTLSLPKTGMAVTIDVGDAEDIHPRDKRTVGERLAAIALRDEFGFDVVASGPTFASVRYAEGRARVFFDHAAGLTTRDGAPPTGFQMAGDDKVFHPVEAQIEDGTVVLTSSIVRAPVAIRYAWEGDPPNNLVNAAGFPGHPFRTDDWDDVL